MEGSEMNQRLTNSILLLIFLFTAAAFSADKDEPDLAIPLKSGKTFNMSAPGSMGSSDAGQQAATERPITGWSERNDLSLPLRWMPALPPTASNVLLEIKNRQVPRKAPKQDPSFRDRVIQDSPFSTDISVTPNIPSTTQNFEGVNNVNGVLPPDTNGSVGPNHYVETVNLSYAVYNKSGTLLLGPRNTNLIWSGFGGACETSNNGDPIVLYDKAANRWLISQFALPDPYFQCIAISQTGDPTGAYFRYAFQMSTTLLNDYPHFGVWPDGYYMSIHNFQEPVFSYHSGGNVAFERSKMLLGQAAQFVIFNRPSPFGGQLPADLDGSTPPPAGTPNYTVQYASTTSLEIWQFHVDWVNTANSTFTLAKTLAVAAFDDVIACGSSGRDCIPQPGTTEKLDAISDRFMFRLAYRNFGTHRSLVANHTVDAGTNKAGIRWYEIRNPGTGATIHQQGTYSPDANHRWMGSIAMDGAGNIALGYSVSNTSLFPSIRYTGRLSTDPLGTLPQGEATIIAGGGSQTHTASRWGDYSSMSIDPVDDCTFWYAQEYLQTTGSAPWRTRIASFKFPGCGGGGCTAPTVTTNNTAADQNACADTGVLVTWPQNPANWNDGGTGTRTYDVLRNGTAIATGLAYGTTSHVDNTGTNGTSYSYSVRYKNGCGSNASTTGVSAADNISSPPVTETANQSGTLTAKNNTVSSVLAPAFTIPGANASSANVSWTLGGNTNFTNCVAIRLRAPNATETTLKATGQANPGSANVLSFYQTNGPGTYSIVLQELAGCSQGNRNGTLSSTSMAVQKPGTCN
jgi:hypothetical protein